MQTYIQFSKNTATTTTLPHHDGNQGVTSGSYVAVVVVFGGFVCVFELNNQLFRGYESAFATL